MNLKIWSLKYAGGSEAKTLLIVAVVWKGTSYPNQLVSIDLKIFVDDMISINDSPN